MGKIQVGYGSDRREGSTKRGLYGNKSNGKRNENGGFNGCPTIDFSRITQEKWDSIFPPKKTEELIKNIEETNNQTKQSTLFFGIDIKKEET